MEFRRLIPSVEHLTVPTKKSATICLFSVFLAFFFVSLYFMDSMVKKDIYHMATGFFSTTGSDVSFLRSSDLSLDELDLDELKFLLHGVLAKNTGVCKNATHFGRALDGGYAVCTSDEMRPDEKACKVLSFGINNEWSFDEAIARYGCYVHSFDPSMGKDDHMHKPNVAFHNLGLGKENTDKNDKGWKMRNIMTVIEELNLTDVIDVIKCDAEGAEWPFLEDVLLNRVKVKQIILEIHSIKRRPKVSTREDFIYMINLFVALRKAGYVVWMNKRRTTCCGSFAGMMPRGVPEKCCHELYLYNKRYANFK